MKVSVIVPVYNVEKYLAKCLDSLVNQTLEDIEIIVVNDGSPDNSEKIILEYKEKYPDKIIYLKKENGGLSDARNFGFKHARGEYISFIDSDDYVSVDTFELLYEKAKTNDFDMVICDLNYIYPDKKQFVHCNLNHDLLTKNEVKKHMSFLYPAVWNKLYKKELIKNLSFKKDIWYEDVEFNFRVYPETKSIGYVERPLIQYVQREMSISKTIDKRLFHYIENFNGLIEYYQKNNFYNDYYYELEYSYVRYLYATFIKQISYTSDEELFQKAFHEAMENVNNNFPNYKKNPYLKKLNGKNIYLKYFNPLFAKCLHIKNKKRG